MAGSGYFPAIVCVVCDSAIDALVALCLPRDEAMALVTASWRDGEAAGKCIVATLHGGRPIAVLATPEGRWAACNAFMDELYATPQEAGRRLAQLLKRGRLGYVGYIGETASGAECRLQHLDHVAVIEDAGALPEAVHRPQRRADIDAGHS